MQTTFDDLFPPLNPPTASAQFKTKPADFMVIEHNDAVFTGQGEHLWLRVEKRESNTAWAAKQIASACQVTVRQVGYAGLKDRHAITQQWFSVQLPKVKDIDAIAQHLPDVLKITDHHWHQSKLKTGYLTCNEFIINLRAVDGNKTVVESRMAQITANGVPNYFGPQRFGHDLGNIQQAQDWFEGRLRVNNKNQRGLLISTARSHIFNAILAQRIIDGSWNQVLAGDVFQLAGSRSWFHEADATMAEIIDRLAAFDIHNTAALWGEDGVQSSAECAALENAMATQFPIYQQGFEKFRVKQDRRAMRVCPVDLSSQWQGDDLVLSFKLPPGAYATTVLRELVNIE